MCRDRPMDKKGIILAGMSAAGGSQHSPVQVQKLFFLIDRKIGDLVGGPFFEFEPYGYGPFDQTVYDVLAELASAGHVDRVHTGRWTDYRLTPTGQQRGEKLLEWLSEKAQSFIKRASKVVHALTFTQLVTAIYKEYPEMRANSVFQ